MVYVEVHPGDPVPEAEGWPNLKSWIRRKFVRWDEPTQCYVACRRQTIKRAPEPAPLAMPEPVTEAPEPVAVSEPVTEAQTPKAKKRGRKPKAKPVTVDTKIQGSEDDL